MRDIIICRYSFEFYFLSKSKIFLFKWLRNALYIIEEYKPLFSFYTYLQLYMDDIHLSFPIVLIKTFFFMEYLHFCHGTRLQIEPYKKKKLIEKHTLVPGIMVQGLSCGTVTFNMKISITILFRDPSISCASESL